jgi:hypothetical protein
LRWLSASLENILHAKNREDNPAAVGKTPAHTCVLNAKMFFPRVTTTTTPALPPDEGDWE